MTGHDNEPPLPSKKNHQALLSGNSSHLGSSSHCQREAQQGLLGSSTCCSHVWAAFPITFSWPDSEKTDFLPVLPVSVIRQPWGTQRGPLTVASVMTWRGSRTSAAQDPITPTDRTGRKSACLINSFTRQVYCTPVIGICQATSGKVFSHQQLIALLDVDRYLRLIC